MNKQAEDTMNAVRKILGIIGVDKDALIMGLSHACCQCDRLGPPEGGKCYSLQICIENGCTYEPPEWCRDPDVKHRRECKG